jgi:hypothetical protein
MQPALCSTSCCCCCACGRCLQHTNTHTHPHPLPPPIIDREYRKYWFFVNLQLSIDRALLGGQQSTGAYPAPLRIKVKPFPWPARQEDLGAASAAAFFNLLLVYAFMAPTRVRGRQGDRAAGTGGGGWQRGQQGRLLTHHMHAS